jgi:hypothetical protein
MGSGQLSHPNTVLALNIKRKPLPGAVALGKQGSQEGGGMRKLARSAWLPMSLSNDQNAQLRFKAYPATVSSACLACGRAVNVAHTSFFEALEAALVAHYSSDNAILTAILRLRLTSVQHDARTQPVRRPASACRKRAPGSQKGTAHGLPGETERQRHTASR